MDRRFAALGLCLVLLAGCAPRVAETPSSAPAETPMPTASAMPLPSPSATARPIGALLDELSIDRMTAHVEALAAVGSRDPRHPGHARAIAYLQEQLRAMPGVRVDEQRFTYQAIPMTNVLATIDPPAGAPSSGWLLILAHYDTTGKATPGWRPALDPAPGADDNGTGTAALLEYTRILAEHRDSLRQRVVLGFMDGEELFFKGSAAYLQIQPRPNPFAAVLNIDMVGVNPIADRLDLVWYTSVSAVLRDRVIAANERYGVGVAPIVPQFATDPNVTIMDIAPWGLSGIPAVAVAERYPAVPDATYPGNRTFHTVGDLPETLTNKRLWLKASKLILATALELLR